MGLKDRLPSRLRAALSHERESRSFATGINTIDEPGKDTSDHDQQSMESDAKPAETGNPISIRALYSLDGLWEEAYRSFEGQNPKLLGRYERSLILLSQNKSGQHITADGTPSQKRDQLQDVIEKQLNTLSAGRLRFSVNGKEVVVREQAEKIVNGVLAVKDVVNAAVASCPPAAIAWAGVVVLLPMLGGMFQQDADAMVGFEFTADLLTQFKFMESKLDLSSLMGVDNSSQEMMTSIRRKTAGLYCQIYTYHIKMLLHYSHSTLTRYLQDIASTLSSSSWKGMLDNLKDTNEQIQRHFQALNSTQMASIHHSISQTASVPRKYSSGPLQQIRDWCEADESKPIFWLHGMAGTGKSTIARTVTSALSSCQWADGSPVNEGTQLVGSFFFRQGDQETSSAALLVPTLAWALLHALPLLEPYILDAIDKHPGIDSKLLSVQWEHLILEPLSKLNATDTPSHRYVVVIDSLDECDDHEQILPMLKLFAKLSSLPSLGMKFFISSRPERHIHTAFASLPQDCYEMQPLQKIQPGMNDIMAFLTAELATVAAKLHLPCGWPGLENIQRIHTKAEGLYVYASTACRFLDDEDFYDSRLEILLADEESELSEDESLDDGSSDGPQQSPQEKLDQMYGKILKSCIKTRRSKEKKDLLQHFKTIVGTIILLLRPLSITSLGCLLFGSAIDSNRQVDKIIGPLNSVIDAQAVDVVVPVHLSFRDFLLNKKRCKTAPEFWIDQQVAHRQILDRCLDTLGGLRQDIFQLKEPGFRAADIPAKEIEKHLPFHMQYACRYWIDHLAALTTRQQIEAGLKDNGRIHTFMLTKFLYWLEALSVMKELTLSITLLKRLHVLASSTATSSLSAFIQDGLRFVLGYRHIIEQAPLQIYCSGLVFCPSQSLVRRQYSSLIPSWILQPPFTPHQWSPELFVLEGHMDDIISGIAWSLNGDYIACKSFNGHVYVWDTFTGGEICSFHDPRRSDSLNESFYLEAIVLSPDGSMLATASSSGGICLRTIATGEVTFMNYNDSLVKHLAISPDGRTLISTEASVWVGHDVGSDAIHAWDVHSKKHLQKYRCHGKGWAPERVMITDSESAWVVEKRKYSTEIRLTRLHLRTGEFTSPISCEGGVLKGVLFSPDGSTLATWDNCNPTWPDSIHVQVWDATSSALRHTFTIESTKLYGLGFAPYTEPDVISADGKLMGVIGGGKFTLMRADQGREFSGIFTAPSYIDKLAFCPRSSLVASSSRDGTVRIWDTDIRGDARTIGESTMGDRTVVQFSPKTDMILVRRYTWERQCRLWNVTNGPARAMGDRETEFRFLQNDRVLIAPKLGERWKGIQICNENLAAQIGELQGVHDFVISDNGQLLACIYSEELQLLETEGCQVIARWTAKDIVDMVTFSADGTTVAVAEHHGCLVHDLQTGKQVFSTPYCRGDPEMFDDSIHLSPYGHFLVTFSEAELEVWDVREQLKVLSMSLNYQDKSSIMFSPDESYFLLKTGSYSDPVLQIWETAQWSKRHTLVQSFCDPIWEHSTISSTNLCAAYVVSTPNQVKLWDLASGEEKGSLDVDGHIWNLRFSPDDQRLYCNRGRLLFSNSLSSDADEDLYVGRYWVRQGSQDLILLPAVYRNVGVVVQGNAIAFAQGYDWAEYLRLDTALSISATPDSETLYCQDEDRISDT